CGVPRQTAIAADTGAGTSADTATADTTACRVPHTACQFGLTAACGEGRKRPVASGGRIRLVRWQPRGRAMDAGKAVATVSSRDRIGYRRRMAAGRWIRLGGQHEGEG